MSVLRPFIATQERLQQARLRAAEVDSLTVQLDSLTSILSTHSVLLGENRELRGLLELRERVGPAFLPATVSRPGTPGSESMFLVDVGAEDGIALGAPVVSPAGLVGVVREVRPRRSVGMDWNHPDFRASAMSTDGSTNGLVGNSAGDFREADRLVLDGVAYNQGVTVGGTIVTSGLGGVFPRGIPIGRVDSIADVEGAWRKSYFLRPMVPPGSATHVLVLRSDVEGEVSDAWPIDSVAVIDTAAPGGPGGRR